MKIVLIHGFNVSDKGKGTVDKLEPLLREQYPDCTIDKDSADYGWIGLFIANWLYVFTNIIKRIAEALKDADMVITHSNGAHFCMKALKRIHNPNLKIVHYSPALNSKWKFNQAFDRCLIFHTRHDKPVKWAKYVPFSDWGDMGRNGAESDDWRVGNADTSDVIKTHSGYFKKDKIDKIFEIQTELLGLSNEDFHFLGRTDCA